MSICHLGDPCYEIYEGKITARGFFPRKVKNIVLVLVAYLRLNANIIRRTSGRILGIAILVTLFIKPDYVAYFGR